VYCPLIKTRDTCNVYTGDTFINFYFTVDRQPDKNESCVLTG